MLKKMFFIAITFSIGTLLYAQESSASVKNVEAPFNITEVIEKVSHHPVEQDDKIVIQDRIYEAFFDEHGVILKPRKTKEGAEDLIIHLTGKPEIKNGKVVYQTEDGEVFFEGSSKGLIFKETYKSASFDSPINKYSGNVAKLNHNPSGNKGLRAGEFVIDTNLVYAPAAWSSGPPSVASDGTNYLVVWYDRRGEIATKIYGSRVNQSGTILDPAGIVISTAPLWKFLPAVAFDGTNYLIVWHDNRYSNESDIYGARVSVSGILLDPEGIAISTADNYQQFPSIVSNGTNSLVVWEDKRNGSRDIYGARVSQSGTVLDPSGIAISTASDWQRDPSVSSDGANYLVVWTDKRSGSTYDIYGARINTSGTVLDPSGIAISTEANHQVNPSVTFSGTNYFVVWADSRSGSDDIYGARINTSGTVLDPSGIAISTEADDQVNPSVAFSGTNYFVVWQDRRSSVYYDIYGARVNQSGTVLDPTGIAISTAVNQQQGPTIAFNGTNYFIVWWDWRGFTNEIYGARVNTSGTVLDPSGIAVSTIAFAQYHPAVGFDGTNYLVVWIDSRNRFSAGNYGIYGARVSQSGTILDPAGITISTEPCTSPDATTGGPSVSFDSTNYLVVWVDERSNNNIYGARISTAGTVLDPTGILISTTPALLKYFPSIAFDGTNYLVAWLQGPGITGYDIYGTRVSQSGTVLDPSGIAISVADDYQLFPSIAYDGTNYLVVWTDSRFSDYDIYGARVNQSGTVLDPSGFDISTVNYTQQYPSVAFDGTNYFVVWEDWRIGTSSDVYGARVDQSGNVLDHPDGIAISSDADDWQESPSVAFGGTNYLVVWQNWHRGDLPPYNIYGAWIDTSGIVFDSLAVSLQSGDQIYPKLTYGQADQLLVTYSGFTDSINGQPATAMRIWGKFYRDTLIYTGQSEITHRPDIITFNYNFALLSGLLPKKYINKQSTNKIAEKLAAIIAESAPDDFIPVFVMLSKQLNTEYLIHRAEQMGKSERRQFVIKECKALALENQNVLLSYLRNKEDEGKTSSIISLWSTNTICFKAKPEVIMQLSQRNDVWEIGYSEPLTIIGDRIMEEPKYKKIEFIPDDGRGICWHIAKINAGDVWSLGYTGTGIVVGHMDTGVNYNHTDLTDHMWDGGPAYPNHGWDFSNNDDDPMDDNWHGTATAGVVAGDGTSGSNTGVAPDAEIMALKIVPGTEVEMGQAIQFALNNDADLLSCSVGWQDPDNAIKDWCRGQSDILYAAGLVWCNAAGNGDGWGGHYPIPQDITAPACCPGPWYAPNGGNGSSIAVGATDFSDNIASWSSYGPTEWNTGAYNDYPYPPGLMKPDVAAPGVNCKSLSHVDNSLYIVGINGTSFAQPHHAGTVALMLSRNPSLTPRQIDSLIQTTALDIEIAGRDSLSGAGRIDALRAVNAISEGSKWAQLWVINKPTATGELRVTDITKAQGSAWLISASPTEFAIPVNDSQEVWVTVDTIGQGLTWGQTYYDTLLIWSNAANVNPDSVPVILIMATIGIEENEELITTAHSQGLSISPNPFRKTANISFSTGYSAESIALKIYDATGRLVKQFDHKTLGLSDQVVWDNRDDYGEQVPAGVYFVRLEAKDQTLTRKAILLR